MIVQHIGQEPQTVVTPLALEDVFIRPTHSPSGAGNMPYPWISLSPPWGDDAAPRKSNGAPRNGARSYLSKLVSYLLTGTCGIYALNVDSNWVTRLVLTHSAPSLLQPTRR